MNSDDTPVFWRSALKASVLVYFAITALSLLYFLLIGSNGLAELIGFFRANREAFDSLQGIVSLLMILQVFSWALFAFIEPKAPVKSLFAKVLVFNGAISLICWLFSELIPPLKTMEEILMKPFTGTEYQIAVFLVSTVALYFAMVFFRKQETNQLPPIEKTAALASPKRRIAAYLIDSVLLGFTSIVIFIVLLIAGTLGFLGTQGLGMEWLLGVSMVFSGIGLLIGMLYWTVLEAKFGATIGKKLLGMKIEKENGSPIGYQEAFFRNSPKFFPGLELVLVVELLFLLGTKKHQRLFDKAAQTLVIKKP